MFMKRFLWLPAAVLLCLSTKVNLAYAQDPAVDFEDMSIEELLDYELTSISKKSRLISETDAAVSVVTAQEIRAAGIQTVADALRLVPGVYVQHSGNNMWDVSIRGLNSTVGQQLLFMVDGRSVISPLYSSVDWTRVQLTVEQIERIEVIRGPATAVWGANAVNGAINVITKKAGDSQGTQVVSGGGNTVQRSSVSHGSNLSDHWSQLVTASVTHDDTVNADSGATHRPGLYGYETAEYYNATVDLRLDYEKDDLQASIQGQFQRSWMSDVAYSDVSLTSPYRTTYEEAVVISSGFLSGNWQHFLSDALEQRGSASYSLTEMDMGDYGNARYDVLNISEVFQYASLTGHDITGGIEFQYSSFDENTTDPLFGGNEDAANRYSVFFNDEIDICNDVLFLTIGTELEYSDNTDFQWQPTLRLRWTPQPKQTWWVAVSRAIRTPSYGELYGETTRGVRPEEVDDSYVTVLLGNEDLEAVRLYSWELGWRYTVSHALSWDATAYYNEYSHLATLEQQSTPVVYQYDGEEYTIYPLEFADTRDGQTCGAELAVAIHPVAPWSLKLAYTVEYSHFDDTDESGDSPFLYGSYPHNQCSALSIWNVTPRFIFSQWLRYIDNDTEGNLPAYFDLNLNMVWDISRYWDISLSGEHLLSPDIQEAEGVSIPRAFYLKLIWSY